MPEPPALVFGPVPSRRLGRSVGINNIPPKVCAYSCVYCQVGRTTDMQLERRSFFAPNRIAEQLTALLERARATGERIDYLTVVPDGEPTLDADLGRLVQNLAETGIPVAVITNGSLLWREDVRHDLAAASWVSVKVDAVDPSQWQRVNRATRALTLEQVLGGVRTFAREFDGVLATETMLARGLNDQPSHLRHLARVLGELRPHVAYVSVPTRPPAESWVEAPPADVLAEAYDVLTHGVDRVELLVEHEGADFASLDDAARDLVATCAVHPMERDAVRALVAGRGESMGLVDELVARGLLEQASYGGRDFYVAGWQQRREGPVQRTCAGRS